MSGAAADRAERPISFAAPFRHSAFTVIWTATLVSNVGGWMYSVASGWLMTSLNPDPLIVALVQAAASLPICLFANPAGALADIFDKRRFLIVVETITTVISAVYALIVGLGRATPANLLMFTFLIGAAGAMTVPAWQAVVIYLVPKDDLPPAIAASAIAGTSWIGALATLSVSAQAALPDWVRARGLALYTTVFFGCLTLGSAAWGGVAVLCSGSPMRTFSPPLVQWRRLR